MKKVIYPVLLIILSSLSFFSCSSSNDEPEVAVEGQWRIYERSFECEYKIPGGGDVTYGEDVTNRFMRALENGDVYNFTFGTTSYLEESFVKTGEGLVRDKSLNGNYTMSENKRIMKVDLPVSGESWKFDAKIVDHNKNFLFFEQPMTSNDVENMILLYFGFIRHMEDGITGTLKTKAVRIKE